MVSRACDVQLPSSHDRECGTDDSDGNVSRLLIPGASTFRLSVELLNILRETLETIYINVKSEPAHRPGFWDAELLRKTLELNHHLDEFLASMPERLSSFIATTPSAEYPRTCDLNLHEQALVTRLAIPHLPCWSCRSSRKRLTT